ncbi:thiamine pyrophosphokinase [Dethiosulfatibacter aminovorans DSM 17477]|uniref:Thiamine diphosphokinase n=1 Tax=Dethiosulfatibacter aminovorans DSM 17477 TaxID=1121476 RepID=A0A1M6DI46_9FIRM|nr:thiamine diphosphokinase [Dethiosulfatibacter aminovorans]SHI72852.1 thiamine pyrophosphokinase [Dethiosulfatibacter aminovorans DSM 17477]
MPDKCLIITGGEKVSKDRIISFVDEDTFIICADKGGETAFEYGLTPDILLGDFDSIDPELFKNFDVNVMEYPEDKDFTDTELAINHALEKGFEKITVANATGDRIDHVFSTFMLLYKYRSTNIIIIGNNFEAFIIDGDKRISNMKGRTLSIIPLERELEGVCLVGFRFPLDNRTVNLGDSLCVSNIIEEDEALIKIKSGTAIVIITDLED